MPILWGITDGSAGMVSQVEGVLQALGLPYVMKVVRRKRPFVWLPVSFFHNALKQLEKESDSVQEPWPDAVVTSGRRSASIALAIKAASGGFTRAIHLTDPRGCRMQFNLIVAMEHDNTPGANVIHTHFALHRVTEAKLVEAQHAWRAHFAALPKPHIGVLIGGSTNKYTLTEHAFSVLIMQLKAVLESTPGSLLITPSRRTGGANVAALKAAFADNPHVFLHDGEGENPYLGILATADHLMITDDSVNMLSEGYSTGKPITLLPFAGHKNTKPARFAARLIGEGVARPFALPLMSWRYPVVNEMNRVVEAVRRVLA